MGQQSRRKARLRKERAEVDARHHKSRSWMSDEDRKQQDAKNAAVAAQVRVAKHGHHKTVAYAPWVSVGGKPSTSEVHRG